MKKSLVIIAVAIIVVSLLGYFSYKYLFLQDDVNVFSLIPEHALVVYESEDVGSDWEKLLKQDLMNELQGVPSFKKAKKDIALLDTLLSPKDFSSIFHERPFLASMHAVSKDEFDLLYFTKINNISDQKAFENIISKLEEENNLGTQSRQFNGFQITELRNPKKGKSFTYIIYKNYFIGSFTTILVEDVIRNINNAFDASFLSEKINADSLTGINTESGKLYINLQRLPDFLSLFKKGTERNNDILNSFGGIAFLEVNMKEGDLFLNGFTDPRSAQKNTWLKTFEGSPPQAFKISNLLPNRTAVLHHMTFDNGQSWFGKLKQYWLSENSNQLDQWDSLQNLYGVSLKDIYSIIGHELGLATLESIEVSGPDKLIYIHAPQTKEAMAIFDSIAYEASKLTGDTVFNEVYGGTIIRQIDAREFPAQVFGPMFSGFESSFYMTIDNYILFGNSVQVLKSLINDIEQEDTWGKSVKFNQFLSSSIKESNYSLMVNIPRSWSIVTNSLSPKWKKYAESYKSAFRSIELWGIQFSNIEDDFYTSVTYRKNIAPPLVQASQKIMNKYQVYFDNIIISKPFLVKSKNKENSEVILQDSANLVYLISSEGRILWKDSIDGTISNDIKQIDYYNNGNIQHLFASDKSIYIYDREGGIIPGFPLTPGYNIGKVNVIDYDKSKKYRFLISDLAGNIYMYNKNGDNLDGWNPRAMEYSLAIPPEHIRVRARDIIYAVEENGVVKAMNRKGEMYSGFPVSLEGKINSPLFVEIGSSFSQTTFTTVSISGMVLQLNMEGEIIKREQLYKPSANTTFKLIESSSGNNFLFVRQDLRRVAILNRKGDLLFEKDYLSSEEMKVQYFYLGTEREFVAVTDTTQDFTYLYDLSGNLINDQPIESSNELELYYSESDAKYYVYSVYEQKLSMGIF